MIEPSFIPGCGGTTGECTDLVPNVTTDECKNGRILKVEAGLCKDEALKIVT